MSIDVQTLCFKSIVGFVGDLDEAFGAVNQPIRLLYKHLEQITFTQSDKIKAVVELFESFCTQYSRAVLEQNHSVLEGVKISHSERAFIDFEYLFSTSTKEQQDYIWEHLLTILAIIDPASRAKYSLQELRARPVQQGGTEKEANILNNIISKIEKQVSEEQSENPVEMVSKIMQSGAFAEIVADLTSSVERGDIDIGKLASSVGLNMPFDKLQGMPGMPPL